MDASVQITLIICATIVISQIISSLKFQYKSDDKNSLEKCKSPTYPPPPRPGAKNLINYNNSELDKMRKPPHTGSGIK